MNTIFRRDILSIKQLIINIYKYTVLIPAMKPVDDFYKTPSRLSEPGLDSPDPFLPS